MEGSTNSIITYETGFVLSKKQKLYIEKEKEFLKKLKKGEEWLVTTYKFGNQVLYIKGIYLLPDDQVNLQYREGKSTKLPLKYGLTLRTELVDFEYEIMEVTLDNDSAFISGYETNID